MMYLTVLLSCSFELCNDRLEAAMQRLTNLCSVLNDMEPICVLNHVFVLREVSSPSSFCLEMIVSEKWLNLDHCSLVTPSVSLVMVSKKKWKTFATCGFKHATTLYVGYQSMSLIIKWEV